MKLKQNELQQPNENNDWKEHAVEYLRGETNAMMDVIIAFVERFWQTTASDEENLFDFDLYESEYQDAYSY